MSTVNRIPTTREAQEDAAWEQHRADPDPRHTAEVRKWERRTQVHVHEITFVPQQRKRAA